MEARNLDLAANIMIAYVAHNAVPPAEVAGLLRAVHDTLDRLTNPPPPVEAAPVPPVPIKQTITADYIVSLESGKRYKSLGRHLTSLGLTPEQYRRKWGLPHDYPMICKNYSAKRSEIAREIRFGHTQKRTRKAA